VAHLFVSIDALEVAGLALHLIRPCAVGDFLPDFRLTLFGLRLLAHAWHRYHAGRTRHRYRLITTTAAAIAAVAGVATPEVLTARPPAVLNAIDFNGHGPGGCFNDAVVPDDAILFAADDHLAGNEDEFLAGIVRHGQAIDFG